MFDKRDIVNWEDTIKSQKTWKLATKNFEKVVASEKRYKSVVSGTAQTFRFESAARMDE